MVRVLLASVLKPCDDVRMFSKLAKTLARHPGTEIHIIGHKVNRNSDTTNIIFHPIFSFPRTHFLRWVASLKYAKYILKVKPDVVIVTTHELLSVTCVCKIFFGFKMYYDVQENYVANILGQSVFPAWAKPLIAFIVRINERFASLFLDGYLVAERCYLDQISFLRKGRCLLLENKVVPSDVASFRTKQREKKTPIVLSKEAMVWSYTGTIGESYGIWEAIGFFENYHSNYPESQLYIVGFCADEALWRKVLERISTHPNIHWEGGTERVEHSRILEVLHTSTMALLPYRDLQALGQRIPTKLWECMALKVPMLIQKNPFWQNITDPSQAALYVDFMHVDLDTLNQQLVQSIMYTAEIQTDIYWEGKSADLIGFLQSPKP